MANELKGTISPRGSVKGSIGVLEKIQGRSAYEVAVINGFEGTEGEWLASLKGEPGKRGERGIQAHYDPETQTLYITGGEEDSGTGGNDGIGIVSIEQTSTSTVSGGVNVITATKADGSKSVFYIRNGGKGDNGINGNSFVGLRYDEETGTWLQMVDLKGSGNLVETEVDAPSIYSKEQIDAMFGNYITDVAALIGGDA